MNFEYLVSNKKNKIEGPLLIQPKIFCDQRGYFYEPWNRKKFNELVSEDVDFVQDNQSLSHKNVLRGLHFQLNPQGQAKLVRVLRGSVYDVIVDLRLNSPTFMEWAKIELDSKKNNQLWIPKGFAHGFLSLEDNTILQYKVNNYWLPDYERTLRWDDKQINIKWHKKNPKNLDFLISNKDKNGLSLEHIIKSNYVYT